MKLYLYIRVKYKYLLSLKEEGGEYFIDASSAKSLRHGSDYKVHVLLWINSGDWAISEFSKYFEYYLTPVVKD